MNTLWERLSRWNRDFPRRATLWQWAVLQAFAAFLAMAVLWAIEVHDNPSPPSGLRWWWAYGVGCIICYTSITTLARYLRTRRRRTRA